jgi:hypothetical protein
MDMEQSLRSVRIIAENVQNFGFGIEKKKAESPQPDPPTGSDNGSNQSN